MNLMNQEQTRRIDELELRIHHLENRLLEFTDRKMIAAMALSGILTREVHPKDAAKLAVVVADTLIDVLK